MKNRKSQRKGKRKDEKRKKERKRRKEGEEWKKVTGKWDDERRSKKMKS